MDPITGHGRSQSLLDFPIDAWIFAGVNDNGGALPPFPSSPVIFDGIGLVHVSFAPESFRGPKDQMLIIRSWELRPDGCRLGIDAVYHPNSKTVYDRGLLLP